MSLSMNAVNQLKSELLLAKGGGIYYDAMRSEADDKTASLFVGLGGTGADMLIRIKNEVMHQMVLPQVNGRIVGDTPNNIGFLAFDTDPETKFKTWGAASFDKFSSEFCSLAVDNISTVIASRKNLAENDDPVWRWYDKIDPIAGNAGSGGLRQIGRLMMIENISKIYTIIQDKIKKMVEVNEGIFSVNVAVVTGISGGTGSGIFIDMAYLLRTVLKDLNIKRNRIFGYIVLPDVNLLKGGQPNMLWANGFAFLKELNYWMSQGSDGRSNKFVQNYGNGVEANITSRVCSYCFLLSSQDLNDKSLTYDKVISSMAENVFTYIAGGECGEQTIGNSSRARLLDNIDAYEVSTPCGYFTIGSNKLEIPLSEISTLLAIRLFEKLAPIFAQRPTEESFKADMTALRLVPRNVIHSSLTERVPASPIDGNIKYQHGQIWGGSNDSYNRNAVYYDVNQWIAREYQTTVARSASNFVNVQNCFLFNFMKDRMKRTDRGPIYISALLKSDSKWNIIPTLEGIASKCDDIAANCDSKRASFEKALQVAYNAGYGKVIMKQKSVERYICALRDWMNNENGAHVYTERARVVRELCEKLKTYYDKVFSKLADVIDAVLDIFRQNLDFITNAQKEATQAGLIDDSKLIWPLKFEAENRAEFERMLSGACTNFLDNLTENLSKWTGCDLETLDENAGGSTDIPGFISRFIGEQFGSLLNINMEEIIKSKLGGAEDLESYLQNQLLRLRESSVPMFSIRAGYHNISTAEFAMVSVPYDCLSIRSAANSYLSDAIIKISLERSRIYYVKVMGIPLYAYAKIEDAEKEYKNSMNTASTRKGLHLDVEWLDKLSSLLPEGIQTPPVSTLNHQVNSVSIETPYGYREFILEKGNILEVESDLMIISSHTYKGSIDGGVISAIENVIGKKFWVNMRKIISQGEEDYLSNTEGILLKESYIDNPSVLYSGEINEKFPELLLVRIPSPRLFNDIGKALKGYKNSINAIFAATALLEFKDKRYRKITMPVLGGARSFPKEDIISIIIKESLAWLNTSKYTNKITFVVFEEAEIAMWNEAMNKILGRNFEDVSSQSTIKELQLKLRNVIYTMRDSVKNNTLLELLNALDSELGQKNLYIQQFGMFGRKIVEIISKEVCIDMEIKPSDNAFSNIESIENSKKVAKWINSYLHSLRVLGNEAVHIMESDFRIPDKLTQGDLLVIFANIIRILEFYVTWKQSIECKTPLT